MSVQPRKLCKLQKGKALGAFDTFVDTFNWMVDFCTNLIGEGEETTEPDESGKSKSSLRVDRSVSDRPVIRGGGGGDEGGSVTITGTDGTQVEDVKSITFMSGYDSNVKVSVSSGEEAGSAVVKIDVYYK